MQRIVEPELLDELPPEDPRAIHSRRDLHRVNALMRSHDILAEALRAQTGGRAPKHIVDLGAGDGAFLLSVALRLASSWPGVCVHLVDRQDITPPSTLLEFARLGWHAECVITDVFEWARQIPSKPVEVVVANLFLHHFATAQLVELFRAVAHRARLLVAVEPRRTILPLCCSHSLRVVGCNAITRHDAVASVRAGFVRRELSALWPVGGQWILTEKSAGVFSHVFSARRCE